MEGLISEFYGMRKSDVIDFRIDGLFFFRARNYIF